MKRSGVPAVGMAGTLVLLALAGCLEEEPRRVGGVLFEGSLEPDLVPVNFTHDFVEGMIRVNLTLENVAEEDLPQGATRLGLRADYMEFHNIENKTSWEWGEQLIRWRWIRGTAEIQPTLKSSESKELFRQAAFDIASANTSGTGFDRYGPPKKFPTERPYFIFPSGENRTLELYFPPNTTHGRGNEVLYHFEVRIHAWGEMEPLHWFSGCFNEDTPRFYGYREDAPGCEYVDHYGRPSWWPDDM